MTSSDILRRINRRATVSLAVFGGLKGAARAVPAWIGTILLLSVVDHALTVPAWTRQAIWSLGFMGSVGLFVSGFLPVRLYSVREKSRLLFASSRHRPGGLKRPDDFHLAWELSKQREAPGLSSELRADFLESIAGALKNAPFFDAWPSYYWKPTVYAGILVAVLSGTVWAFLPVPFPLSSRIWFPFGSRTVDRFVSVYPGDAVVPKGSLVEVKITSALKSLDKPELFVKSGGEWLPVETDQFVQGVQIYRFDRVVEPIQYRVRWRNDWGRRYRIDLFEPVRIESFRIRMRDPDYVGGKTVEQTSPELSGLPGTAVALEAKASQPVAEASLSFSDGSEVRARSVEGAGMRFEFTLTQSGRYRFRLTSADGRTGEEGVFYPIYIKEDAAPTIVLLSPDEDLLVGLHERLPVTYSAEDDYGVASAFLIWEKPGGSPKSIPIRTFSPPVPTALETIHWDLEKMGFGPGDVIRFRIKVLDHNTITGPGATASAWRTIEMSSFEKTHEALEEALEVWRDQMVELLADVSTERSKAESEATDTEALTQEFNQTALASRRLQKALEKIVSMMEDDPMADYSLWSEHSAMADNMEAMNAGAVKRAQAALQTKNKETAAREMDRVAAEVERMISLSEDLTKTQKARDVRDAGEDLEKAGRDLMRNLEEAVNKGQKLSRDELRPIEEKVNEAMKILSEMATQIQKFPDQLPEDFVNQQALKDLKMQETGDLLSEIRKAIQSGDASKALELAKKFLEMAERLREQLAEAHDSYLDENSAGQLGEKISAEQKKLEALAASQRGLLADTQKLESKRLGASFQAQQKRLQELAKRQKRVIEKTEGLFRKGFDPAPARTGLGTQIVPMKTVLREFEAMQVRQSRTILPSIIDSLKALRGAVVRSSGTAAAAGAMGEAADDEQSIFDVLNKPVSPANPFGPEDHKTFKDLSRRQKDLQKETQNVRQSLQRLSQKTASLGIPLTQSLSEAAGQMGNAGEHLSSNESGPAQQAEETALRHLQSAMNSLQQAQNQMGQMAMQRHGGSGGRPREGQPRVLLRGGAGSRGVKTGRVKLPTADDYKPPKEFREELLKSLREKYPDIYEGVIQKYFKKLSE